MVRRTLEVFECDVCGNDGRRYTVLYEDGALVMDRCERHDTKLENLRKEKGEWRENRAQRGAFNKATVEDLRRALADGKPA